jgi:hypothetical protein
MPPATLCVCSDRQACHYIGKANADMHQMREGSVYLHSISAHLQSAHWQLLAADQLRCSRNRAFGVQHLHTRRLRTIRTATNSRRDRWQEAHSQAVGPR